MLIQCYARFSACGFESKNNISVFSDFTYVHVYQAKEPLQLGLFFKYCSARSCLRQ